MPERESEIVTIRMPRELAEWLRDEMGGRRASEAQSGWVYMRVLVGLMDAAPVHREEGRRGMPKQRHECDWCLDELPCAAVGPLWICGDCEADVFMFPAAMGGDLSPQGSPAPVHCEEGKRDA